MKKHIQNSNDTCTCDECVNHTHDPMIDLIQEAYS